MNPGLPRLWQLIDLVEREDRHLLGVRSRLFSAASTRGLGVAELSS
jgi:hypothetical protein